MATVTDLLFDKIYNEWILIGAAAGLSYAVWQGGGDGLIRALLSMAVPIVLLYPLFMIGGLGAGDIKLIAVAGCFLTIKETVLCLTFLTFSKAVNGNFMRKILKTGKRKGKSTFPCRYYWL